MGEFQKRSFCNCKSSREDREEEPLKLCVPPSPSPPAVFILLDKNKINFDRLLSSKPTLNAKPQELIGTFFKFLLENENAVSLW